MRTRLRICKTKIRFADQASALIVAQKHEYLVRAYRCDRCGAWHLTSRRKGKRMPRPIDACTQSPLQNAPSSGSAV